MAVTPPPGYWEWFREALGIPVAGNTGKEVLKMASRAGAAMAVQQVVESTGDPAGISQVATALRINRDYASALLREAASDGLIERVDRGKYLPKRDRPLPGHTPLAREAKGQELAGAPYTEQEQAAAQAILRGQPEPPAQDGQQKPSSRSWLRVGELDSGEVLQQADDGTYWLATPLK